MKNLSLKIRYICGICVPKQSSAVGKKMEKHLVLITLNLYSSFKRNIFLIQAGG